ncbi:MAG: hypothetical protein RR293_00825 [Bacteroidales bacterium]
MDISKIYKYEKYIPVMTAEELSEFEKVIAGEIRFSFSLTTILNWQILLKQYDDMAYDIAKKEALFLYVHNDK